METHTAPDDFRKVREMSTEQREELYQRLIAADGIDVGTNDLGLDTAA